MKNVMREQIINLFNDSQRAMSDGLWFSGYKGEGEFKLWYYNGQLQSHWFYKNGLFDGEFKRWDSRGELLHHEIYKDGNIVRRIR
jgi:antitoxin component YwqK of YwqJK toxin-antitoxin module